MITTATNPLALIRGKKKMRRGKLGILGNPSTIMEKKKRKKLQLGGVASYQGMPSYQQNQPSPVPPVPNYKKGGKIKGCGERENHSLGDVVRGVGRGIKKAANWVKDKAIPAGKGIVKGLHSVSGVAKHLPVVGNVADTVHKGTGKIREMGGFKSGGLAKSHQKKIHDLARQAGMTSASHKKAISAVLKRAKGGEVTKNHIAKLAAAHGIHDPRQHHFLGKIVDFAKKAWSKGKEAVKAGHNFYNKHKDTIHKGLDVAGKVTGKGHLAEKAKSGLNKANSYVSAHRDQYGYKEGGCVGGRLNILKLKKTKV